LLVLALVLPIWSFGLFYRGIWMPDEPREYDVAYHMLQSGDLVTPRLAGEAFLEKPPLAYWAQSAGMRAFGVSIATARLPNLLWATLTLLSIGMLAGDLAPARLRNQAALVAALVCGTMILVLYVQIWLATDAPLVAMTAAALLSAWRLAHAETSRQEVGWSLLLGAALAGAFLAKSGFGLLVPALTMMGWLSWERRLQQLRRWRWWATAGWFALFAGGWLMALALQPGGREQVHALLWDNLVARFLPVHSNAVYELGHRSPHWTFLLLLPVYVVPWTFAMLGAARWGIDSLRRPAALTSAVRFCIASVVPSCIVLLLSRTARDIYFAPALLCLPVLLALWLTTRSDHFTDSEQSLLRWTRRTLEILAALIACAAAILLILTGIHNVPLAAFVALIAFVLVGTHLSLRATHRSLHGILAATEVFILAVGTFEVLAFPTIDRAENLGALVIEAAPKLKTGRVALYCGDETIRATLDYAIGLRLQNVCATEAAERLLRDHGDYQFLVELAPARSAQRIKELFPSLDTSRWKFGNPRTVKRVSDLAGLGLQPTARWSVPGGRKYALYGRAHPGAGRCSRYQ
jgi:4-amino-4-deoxy-L-arabinose transferase-like glycosyltransferase